MNKMFSVKVHNASGDIVVAGCDREILGKTLSEGDFEIVVNERFYGSDVVDAERLLKHIEEATIVNLLGDRIVELAVERKLVSEGNVRKVAGVKHAQIVTIPNKVG